MRTASIHAGDIILCNVRGQKFYATVVQPITYNEQLLAPVLEVEGLTKGNLIPTRYIKARQIERHWRASRLNARRNHAAQQVEPDEETEGGPEAGS